MISRIVSQVLKVNLYFGSNNFVVNQFSDKNQIMYSSGFNSKKPNSITPSLFEIELKSETPCYD
jgi:hypothetical protein